ncbi:MAG: ParA family protein [Pseudomonadota bacterium]
MLTILVANVKGGCGKTTIATHLAAAFANGGLNTVLADADRQRSSLGWLKRRPKADAAITGQDWTKEIVKTPKRCDRLVIDAPAALRIKQAEDFIRAADIVVVPVLPSAFDEKATTRFLKRIDALKPIRKSKTDVAVVGNRMRARTRAGVRLEEFLAGQGHLVAARIRDSAFYAELAADGRALFDLTTKRAAGLALDWDPLIATVERSG